MRHLALILLLFAPALGSAAAETNYFCVICGTGPLTGRIWMSQWGAVCESCYKLENHCALCGLPIGKDFVKTGDGRFICKFDKTNAVLEVSAAREVFTEVRRELVGRFGQGFALGFSDVTVNLFDVDYWSETGRSDGLHKFGFASTRRTPKGDCTHEVVMLSGRLRNELAATAAHEYTHLWISENCPKDHGIDGDTMEAICELAAYKLMESRSQAAQLQTILDNPYTHGEIKKLVEREKEIGFGSILNWVKNGTGATLDTPATVRAVRVKIPALAFTNVPPPFPATLKLGGLLLDGQTQHAVISGVSFAAGDVKHVPLQRRTVRVHCCEITRDDVTLEVAGWPGKFILRIGEEKDLP